MPAYWRMVQRRPRYIVGWMPRVKGYSPGEAEVALRIKVGEVCRRCRPAWVIFAAHRADLLRLGPASPAVGAEERAEGELGEDDGQGAIEQSGMFRSLPPGVVHAIDTLPEEKREEGEEEAGDLEPEEPPAWVKGPRMALPEGLAPRWRLRLADAGAGRLGAAAGGYLRRTGGISVVTAGWERRCCHPVAEHIRGHTDADAQLSAYFLGSIAKV